MKTVFGAPTAVAHLRFVRMAPRKLRRVADAIRGKSVKEAFVLLKFAGVFAADPIEKLLRSAVANAGNNHDMNTDELYVTRITVDGGPGGRFTKRLDPRAQAPVKKRRARGGASISLKRAVRKGAAAAAPSAAKAPAKRKASTRKASSRKKKTATKAGAAE